MACLVMFLPENKSAMSTVFLLHLDCMFAHVFVVFLVVGICTLKYWFPILHKIQNFFFLCIKCTNEWDVRSRNVNFNLNVENY